jgi:hypothetical protein
MAKKVMREMTGAMEDIPRDELGLTSLSTVGSPERIVRETRVGGVEYQLKRIGDAVWVIVALMILSWIIVGVVLTSTRWL